VSTSNQAEVAQRMEHTIQRYFTACNTGDVGGGSGHVRPRRRALRPAGHGGPARGGRAIGELIARLVQAGYTTGG
jgi:hypothetical protein